MSIRPDNSLRDKYAEVFKAYMQAQVKIHGMPISILGEWPRGCYVSNDVSSMEGNFQVHIPTEVVSKIQKIFSDAKITGRVWPEQEGGGTAFELPNNQYQEIIDAVQSATAKTLGYKTLEEYRGALIAEPLAYNTPEQKLDILSGFVKGLSLDIPLQTRIQTILREAKKQTEAGGGRGV